MEDVGLRMYDYVIHHLTYLILLSGYSFFKELTGLLKAATRDFEPTVRNAIPTANNPAIANIHHSIFIL